MDDVVILGECSEDITGSMGSKAVQVLNRHKPVGAIAEETVGENKGPNYPIFENGAIVG